MIEINGIKLDYRRIYDPTELEKLLNYFSHDFSFFVSGYVLDCEHITFPVLPTQKPHYYLYPENRYEAWVFGNNNAVVGFVIVRLPVLPVTEYDGIFIEAFWVAPYCRRKGWGKYMMYALTKIYPKVTFELHVMDENESAKAFWATFHPIIYESERQGIKNYTISSDEIEHLLD